MTVPTGPWRNVEDSTLPLAGIRVVDAATLFAGPLAAMVLGDFGADVIRVEHPKGDPSRGHGASKDGVPLWWKMLARNKRAVTLYLGDHRGQSLFKRLIEGADVVVENFRPGTLERWGLGYDVLSRINPRMVLVRVTAFGQFGPYASRRGFGTLAEAMSGFASMTGEPDGPPTLPPLALADGIAGLAAAFATMTALRARETTGRGQVVDLSIIEPIVTVLGPQPTIYDQLGVVQPRVGNRSVNNAPRNTYRTRDGKWIAVSSSSQSVAERVMRLVGRGDLAARPWFATGESRARHADEIDQAVGEWIRERTLDEALKAFDEAGAAAAPVYDTGDLMRDPQIAALDAITRVPDPELGTIRMQNVLFRLSETPGSIRNTGPRLGEHNGEVYGSLGLGARELRALAAEGVV